MNELTDAERRVLRQAQRNLYGGWVSALVLGEKPTVRSLVEKGHLFAQTYKAPSGKNLVRYRLTR